ncbi:MAG: hypothetical protein PHT96_14485 [Syntrophorhabdaceae bacterium]|nr:hypothetical protein [Syntrophorhabdaceae bacterium]
MSGTNFLKERTLADKIIDKHLRRIAGIALEKGYNGLPFIDLKGEIFSGDERVGYIILGSKGSQFTIRVEPDDEENKDRPAGYLGDLGITFSKYAKPILSDAEARVRALPRIDCMADSFDGDLLEAAARFLYNTGHSDYHVLGIGIMTRPGQVPVIGSLFVRGIQFNEHSINEIKSVLSNQKDITRLEDKPFHALHSAFSIAPFLKDQKLFDALRACADEKNHPLLHSFSALKPEIFTQILKACARLKGYKTFGEAVRRRFGDISLLTKKQQEAFVDNTRKALNSMPSERFHVYRGISVVLGGGGFDDDDLSHPLTTVCSNLRQTNKKTDTAALVRSILEIICSMESWYLKMTLRVPLPAALGGGEAEFGYPCQGYPPSSSVDQLFKNAIEYAHFLDLVAGAPNTAEGLNETARNVIQGFACVLDGVIEKMASGRNAVLVSIMKGETKAPGIVRQRKEHSDKDWIFKIAQSVIDGIKSYLAIIGEAREAGLVDAGIGDQLISFAVEGVESLQMTFQMTFRTLRDVPWLEGYVEMRDGSGGGPVFKIRGHSASRIGIAELMAQFAAQNPGSDFVSVLRASPAQLLGSLQQGFEEYAGIARAVFDARIEREKEAFYRTFQTDFSEDLFEDYCTGPAN